MFIFNSSVSCRYYILYMHGLFLSLPIMAFNFSSPMDLISIWCLPLQSFNSNGQPLTGLAASGGISNQFAPQANFGTTPGNGQPGFGQSSAHGSPFAAPSFQPQANGQGPAGKLFAVHTENEQPRGQHSGTLGCSTVGYQCLTAQPQFAHLSLEECRLENYGIKEQVILALLSRIENHCM